jgi:hypothetical protein
LNLDEDVVEALAAGSDVALTVTGDPDDLVALAVAVPGKRVVTPVPRHPLDG